MGTRAGGEEVTWEPCKTGLIDREHEKEIIDEWLPEKNGNLKEGLKEDFLFYAETNLSLEFYPVFSQTSTPNDLGLFYYDADGEYHEVIVWEDMNPWGLTETEWKWSEEKGSYSEVTSKGIRINIPAGCEFGFFWKGHNNTGETKYYSISDKNEEVNCTDGNGNPLVDGSTSKIHAVTFVLEGKTYLGLEDWTDFDFQDWVFTCDQVLKSKPEQDPENDEGEGKGDNGGDDDGEVDDPQPATPGHSHDNEVEVNLAIDDKGGYLDSHLSIHVRAAVDVEIFIPVPAGCYIQKDDMDILGHFIHEGFGTYGGGELEKETIRYQIGDSVVTLTVAFEAEGIRITTNGINEEVMKFCRAEFHDGITFEIWNYFNDEVTKEMLKGYLDQATIEFLDGEKPDYYINAFTEEGKGDYDCTVSIVDKQADVYGDAVEGSHLNGSSVNEIYTRNDIAE